jgi:hypothetical protein
VTRSMGIGLAGGHVTLHMLTTVLMLQRDRVWNSLTRRRHGVALGADGGRRRRVAFDGGLLVVCLVVLVGLVVLGVTLLSLFSATLSTSTLESCPEVAVCAVPEADGNESLRVDDPLTDGLRMTR